MGLWPIFRAHLYSGPEISLTGCTFDLIPYFCALNLKQHIGDPIISGGSSQISGGKDPLQRVNGNADFYSLFRPLAFGFLTK